jgi:hypothetical protein
MLGIWNRSIFTYQLCGSVSNVRLDCICVDGASFTDALKLNLKNGASSPLSVPNYIIFVSGQIKENRTKA